ncbi:MAG: hypothetical protein JXR23_10635 [Pontiellaceae bacterium]|nr:hypothetical protein [Pontiellaceae bacterium]
MEKFLIPILVMALTAHFFFQRLLLAKGMASENPKPIIQRLFINGIGLAMLAVFALLQETRSQYGMLGLLILFEAGVCTCFALTLLKRK